MGEEHGHSRTQAAQRRRGIRLVALGFVAVLLLAVLVLILGWSSRSGRAGAHNTAQVASGQHVYAAQCARCHGLQLEGQPNWKERRPDGSRPAPPHDETGHTWHHPDQLLFEIVKDGMQKYALQGEKMTMPAFEGMLSDDEIWAVLAYIKSTWPPDIQAAQEQVNHQTN